MISGDEDWTNVCWNFSFAITGINYILKYIKIENSYFTVDSKHTVFTVLFCFSLLWSSLGEHETSSKNGKNLTKTE